ncbi:MAG: HEAT repeat domain-containing protein [Phycisphaerae bacterium]|nr:HEAT repeat domain-containing protein [Planctomycetia bacterium]MCL4720268.1 HEAT repeat domain-containing protein [Phycisphaerae bacterium]
MTPELTLPDVEQLVNHLRENRGAVAWTERRHIPAALVRVLQAIPPAVNAGAAAELLNLLASDPKWEVRKAVADALRHAQDDRFTKTLVQLSGDENTFVRRAADGALERRRSAPASANGGLRVVSSFAGKLAQLEQKHGTEAARLARQIGETYYDQLVGATAHDARGILTPLASRLDRMIDQLARMPVQPGRLRRSLQQMRERVDLLAHMVDDMRSFALPVPPTRRPERLAEILAEAERLAQEAVDGRGNEPSNIRVVQAVDGAITVEVARDRVLMAFVNVIKNAFESFPQDATANARSIRITAGAADGVAKIRIQDNGTGMPKEDLAQILEFLPGGKTKKNEGTGFGLPIARRSIVAHGGTLTIESEEGLGTTVTVTLPLEHGGSEA